MPEAPGASGSFFGRRKGKALRPGHEALLRDLLPAMRAPILDGLRHDPCRWYAGGVEAVRLEIGFGGGEHLAAAARASPDTGFIGCEPFVNGVAKLLAVIQAEGLGNIRIWTDDATDLLPSLEVASLAGIDLLFPDPWPKRRQRKRRFVSDRSLAALARVLKPGAPFRFATDIDDYAGWTLVRILRSGLFDWPATGSRDWREPWPGWPGTRYEAKGLEAGRPASYLVFRRNAVPVTRLPISSS